MPEQDREKFIEIHSTNISQYVLGLNDLPSKEEFIENYVKLTSQKAKPSKKRKSAESTYEWLKENGLL